jgi:TolB-like protein/Flp pilus assembly protein TadD
MGFEKLIAELRRRNVLRVGAAYVVASWLLVQISETIFPLFGFDDTPARIVVIVLAIGFLPALVFSWIYELTPQGLLRESEVDRRVSITPHTGRKLDRSVMVMLVLALVYFASDKFILSDIRTSEILEAARQEGRNEALTDRYGDNSIAVLAFEDRSPNQDQEYFSDGVAEELLNLLSRVPNLRVISRRSAFSYKDKDVPISQIATDLDVVHILEGSIRKSGDRVRVAIQLVDARVDTNVWAQTYDREMNDIFAVQDEIAGEVLAQLKVHLLGDPPRLQQTDSDSYALYLQARHLIRQATAESYAAAVPLLEDVLQADSAYAPAFDALAQVRVNQAGMGLRPADDAYEEARDAASRAVKLDSQYAPAIGRLAWIAMMYDADLGSAARYFEDALSIVPNEPTILTNASVLATLLGRTGLAIELGNRAAGLDPTNMGIYFNLGVLYLWDGSLQESSNSFAKVSTLSSGKAPLLNYYLGVNALLRGLPDTALEYMEAERSENWKSIGRVLAHYELGNQEESDKLLNELLDSSDVIGGYRLALAHAYLGNLDQAFHWLDDAAEQGDPYLAEIVGEPLFSNLHGDPRWRQFLVRIGRAPQDLASIAFEPPFVGPTAL